MKLPIVPVRGGFISKKRMTELLIEVQKYGYQQGKQDGYEEGYNKGLIADKKGLHINQCGMYLFENGESKSVITESR